MVRLIIKPYYLIFHGISPFFSFEATIRKKEMKAEYNNLYVHYVLTVKEREPLIDAMHRKRIEKYITGIIRRYKCRLYSIYANPEHIHILVSKSPEISDNELISRVASSTEEFINREKLLKRPFKWQETFSAFSVSKRDVNRVCQYIQNQPVHHKLNSYASERIRFEEFYQKTIAPMLEK